MNTVETHHTGTITQRQKALASANAIRADRSRFRAGMTRGREPEAVADMIVNAPDWALTLRIWDVLGWIPSVGQGTIGRDELQTRWLTAADVSAYRTLGRMSERQRLVLAEQVRDWGSRR